MYYKPPLKIFLLNFPAERRGAAMHPPGRDASYKITRRDTNVVALNQDNKAKNEKSKPMGQIQIYKTDYITNVLVPDSLKWLSKKELDYNDLKLIFTPAACLRTPKALKTLESILLKKGRS
jgi:hypothetical protein